MTALPFPAILPLYADDYEGPDSVLWLENDTRITLPDESHITSWCYDGDAACVLTTYGMAYWIDGTDIRHQEHITANFPVEHWRRNSECTQIRRIDGALYVCGIGGTVYRRTQSGWQAMDQGLAQNADALFHDLAQGIRDRAQLGEEAVPMNSLTTRLDDLVMLYAIGGRAADDLYVAGFDGRLYHWNGARWQPIATGTLAHFYCMDASLSKILLGGVQGTLLEGNAAEGFTALLDVGADVNFWHIARFGDAIYLGTGDGLMRATRSRSGWHAAPFTPPVDGLDADAEILAIEVRDGTLTITTTTEFLLCDAQQRWSRYATNA